MKLYHNEKNSSMAVWQFSTTLWLHDGGLTVLGDSRCCFGGESAFSLQKICCKVLNKGFFSYLLKKYHG